jgi:hypothetical protein
MQFRSIAAASTIVLSFCAAHVPAACCYFVAKDKDINQPAQKAFITWEPDWKSESFTVQPKFEGNAEYIQAPKKMDLPELFSFEDSFTPMWNQALSYAIPAKVTSQEKNWRDHVGPQVEKMTQFTSEVTKHNHEPATLEWAKKLTVSDLGVLSGETKYNRDAPAEDVKNLKILKGHLKSGQFLTKFRKVFAQDEMTDDLRFYPAEVAGKQDEIEYFSILPTSPP